MDSLDSPRKRLPFPPADSPPQDYVYSLVIADSAGFVGISTEVPLNITQLEILPNPSSEVAQIKYTSSESQGVHLTMYNLIGEKLLDRETESSFGSNSIDLGIGTNDSFVFVSALRTTVAFSSVLSHTFPITSDSVTKPQSRSNQSWCLNNDFFSSSRCELETSTLLRMPSTSQLSSTLPRSNIMFTFITPTKHKV